MNNIGYKNLEKAIQKNELRLYLISDPKYRTNSIIGADVMNDFFDIVYSLNEYGNSHIGFDKIINEKLNEILNENKIFYTYSVANIIKEQIELESKNKNKISFIDEKLLENLRHAITSKKQDLKKLFDYEGVFYNNGLMGVYELIDNNVYESTGHHIL